MKLNKKIIEKTRRYVKKTYDKTEFLHSWDHIQFVIAYAKYIAKKEGMDVKVVEMGALLHDISQVDMKMEEVLEGDHATPAAKKAEKFLKSLKLDEDIIEHILDTIRYHSQNNVSKAKTREALAVYDGDKLDCSGARGFIRVLCWETRYEHPDAHIDELYELALASNKKRLTKVRTKTGKQLAKKYFKQIKEFIRGYEQVRRLIS